MCEGVGLGLMQTFEINPTLIMSRLSSEMCGWGGCRGEESLEGSSLRLWGHHISHTHHTLH